MMSPNLMIYLESIHSKENMCQFSCKNNNFPRNYGICVRYMVVCSMCAKFHAKIVILPGIMEEGLSVGTPKLKRPSLLRLW